jgi:hypothetical protein
VRHTDGHVSGYEPPAWAVEYHTALAQGDYLRARSVARDAADDSAPISFYQ